MQTALLIFIVIISLAIGFFGGLLITTMNQSEKKDGDREESAEISETPRGTEMNSLIESARKPSPPVPDPQDDKPTAEARLVLRVYQEPGQPPLYEYQERYVPKESLPEDLLHLITVRKSIEPSPAPQDQPTSPAISPVESNGNESEVKLLSVIEEIEKILQEKLENSALIEKGIHLMENHNKEIRIWVGLDSYDTVDDIPDLAIQQIINSAVKDWEERNN